MKTNNIKAITLGLVTLLLSLSATIWAADVTPSTTLKTYYTSIEGKTGEAIRTQLNGIISSHTTVSYDNLIYLFKYSDTYNAEGTTIEDIYSACDPANTTSWCSGDCGYNREHSVPKSWFGTATGTPQYSDAFHLYPTNCYVNSFRGNLALGECANGTKCTTNGVNGKGRKGTSTFVSDGGTNYASVGTVYEPDDEYKGDLARSYFYMVTCYRTLNFTQADGGVDMFTYSNGVAQLSQYSIDLLLKWHRNDPVSKKELIRNEVIYGNSTYNKSNYKQNNRNPFIDYPELVEYIWGNKNTQAVSVDDLVSAYSDDYDTGASTYNVTLYRMGVQQVLTGKSGTFVLPTDATEANACGDWKFAGWVTTAVSTATTTKPTFVTQVTEASTLYAVYSKTESSGSSAPIRKANATVGTTLWAEDFSGFSANDVPNTSYSDSHSGTTVYSGSVTYSVTNGGGTTKVYNENSGGGTAPEILIAQNNGTLSISGIPTGDATEMSLTFVSNKTTFSVTTESTALDIDGSGTSWTISVKSGQTTPATFDLTIKNTGSKNARVDNIVLKVTTAGSDSGSGGDDPTPSTTTTYDSDPDECHCTGNLATPTNVKATPSNGTITLTWNNDANATNGYTVTIGKGQGYTTECADPEIGTVTLSGSTNTCVITGLVNGLEYTASVVANATATTCESAAGSDSATPIGCESWNVTLGYNTYSLTAGGSKATPTITGTTYGSVTYSSSNEAIITVDENGKVTPVSAGTATVTARWEGDATHCPKEVTSGEFTVTGLVRITFNANDGSETPATATQDVTYNVTTALTAINTIGFSRTGYTFQGWSTDPNATSATYTDGCNITITVATTLYAVWQVNTHKVTFSPSLTGATVKVNNSSTSPVSNVAYGSTVNIVVTPAAHYTISSVTANGGVSVTGSGYNWSFTMPDKDVEITVTMTEETKYTVKWYVNNVATDETNYAGSTLAGIPNPTIDCNGKTFQGWTESTSVTGDKPDDLFTNASTKTMPSNNNTKYYAVFATETTSGSGTVYKLVETLTNGKDYVFVTRNTDGNGYAFSSAITTGTSVSIVADGSDKIVSGTPADAIIWTAATGWSLTTKDETKTNKVLKINGTTFALDATGSNNLAWTTNYGLNGKSSGSTKYYLQCDNNGTFSKSTTTGSSTNRVWAYEKTSGGQTTTYTGYTTSCSAPTDVTVTFHANYDGADPATATQTIQYNTSTALDANPFSRTGYSFAGWATSASGTKEYDNQASVTLTKNQNLYALWTKNSYNVTFTPDITDRATVTVNGASTSPQSVEFGGSVNIIINPDVAYTVSSVTATGGVTPSGSGNNWAFTMPASDVTVTVNLSAKPTNAIRFFNMGEQVGETQNLYAGATAKLPAAQTACEGYTFLGWWTATLAEDNTESHTWVTTDFTVTGAQDYHAVYSKTEGGSGSGGSSTITLDATTDTSFPKDGISLTTSNGVLNNGTDYRIYKGATLTITSSVGDMTSIAFTFDGSNDGGGWKTSYTPNSASWTSPACTSGNSGKQARITQIVITIEKGGGSTYYTTAPNCADCTNTVTITKGTPSNGSFSIDKTDEQENCSSAGLVVTVSGITPDEGYRFKEITQSGINAGVTIDNEAKTVTYAQNVTGESTINVLFEALPTYTIRFIDNGSIISTQSVYAGAVASKPDDPTICNDYTFVGWWEDELGTDNTTSYTWLNSFGAVYADQDFYAVYELVEGGSGGSGSVEFDFQQIASDNSWEHDSNHPEVTISPVTIHVTKTSGNYQGRWWNTDKTYRLYAANTITITCSTGDITAVTSNPSKSFNIDNGEATFTGAVNLKSISVTYSGGGTTYYTTAPIVTSGKMLVAEYGGARVALAHDNTNTVAALPMMYLNGDYFIPNLDKNGNAISAPNKTTLTWQVAECTDGYYIKLGEQFLAQTEGVFTLENQKFLWSKDDGIRIAYNAVAETFVADQQGEFPGITSVDVPSTIKQTELNSQRAGFTNGDFGTICLPHAVALPFAWGVKAYNIEGKKMNGSQLAGIYIVEETEMLTAGKPYLIEALDTKMTMWYPTGAPTVDEAVPARGLVGNLSESPKSVPSYCYGISNNQLRRVGEGTGHIAQYRAYIDLTDVDAGVPQQSMCKVLYTGDSEDITTDTEQVSDPTEINWNEPVYNILGIRVDRNCTGVLIQNGKKFLVTQPRP